jgi:cell division protein FtsB
MRTGERGAAVQPRRTPGHPGSPRSRVTPARTPGSARTAGSARIPSQSRVVRTGQACAAADQGRSASRPASARRIAAGGAAKRTQAPQPRRFTGRATIVGCLLGALLLTYVYPVRIYLDQQAQIASIEGSQAAQQARIQHLSDESAKYNDPEYVAAQAKSSLLMVKPGDVVYLPVDAASPAPVSTDPDAGRAKNTGPWYGKLWSSLQAADKPRGRP